MKDTFLAVDVETTGLSVERRKIIEIGAVKYVDGEKREEFSSLICPDEKLRPAIIELTGITDEILCDAPNEKEVMKEFLEFAGDHILLGHNLNFDYSFLKTAANRHGHEFERMGQDTLLLCKRFHPELKSRALDCMCRHYQIYPKQSHRALDDAAATAELYFNLKDKFYKREEEVFLPRPLSYQPKKQEPMTGKQKKYLLDLAKYHKINVVEAFDTITKSEASRMIDQIILKHGKMSNY